MQFAWGLGERVEMFYSMRNIFCVTCSSCVQACFLGGKTGD